MSPDSIHFETIDLIRQITSDGKLEHSEVWDLADHLNNNRLARQRWPGSRLWPIIQEVYADNVVTADEMRMLGEEITDVEEICSDITGEANDDRPEFDLTEVRVSPIEAPVVPKTVYIHRRDDSKRLYAANLRDHSCTCEDWREIHEVIPEHGFGRLCQHLVDALHEVYDDPKVDTNDWADPVTNLIYILHRFRHPADPLMHWQFLEWKDKDETNREAYVAFGSTEWATVFANKGKDIYERYGFSLLKQRWSYGSHPPGDDLLAFYLTHHAKELGGVLG